MVSRRLRIMGENRNGQGDDDKNATTCKQTFHYNHQLEKIGKDKNSDGVTSQLVRKEKGGRR